MVASISETVDNSRSHNLASRRSSGGGRRGSGDGSRWCTVVRGGLSVASAINVGEHGRSGRGTAACSRLSMVFSGSVFAVVGCCQVMATELNSGKNSRSHYITGRTASDSGGTGSDRNTIVRSSELFTFILNICDNCRGGLCARGRSRLCSSRSCCVLAKVGSSKVMAETTGICEYS